mmetsp:Transcript_45909/g.46600  ORF Transcript_45909/g.46600 Transcript_45909/m.46600 type:complete len:114 (+) Transcript_45909:484-825(+)
MYQSTRPPILFVPYVYYLHNFCIDQKEPTVPSLSSKDTANIATESGITSTTRTSMLRSMVGGGYHNNDVSNRRRLYKSNDNNDILHRTTLLHCLIQQGKVKRPKPMGSTTTNT